MPHPASATNPTHPQFDKILKTGIRIPPQPKILDEIRALSDSPKFSLATAEKLIERDIGLSAAIFKVVNSPAYGLHNRVTSVSKALAVLGIDAVTQLVKAIELRRSLPNKGEAYERFWERSGDIASLASLVAARQISACNIAPEQAYLAGLFHDCGVPILMEQFPDYCATIAGCVGGNWGHIQKEDAIFDTDHAVVGYLLARNWRLPDFVCEAIRFHHDLLSVQDKALTLVSILQMGIHLCNRITARDDAGWEDMRDKVLQEIGLGYGGVDEFEDEIIESFREQGR